MARALIVGCGCRGQLLGRRLGAAGWLVRGTTRDPATAAEIEAAGFESAIADPDRIAEVVEHIADIAVLYWLLGSAAGDPKSVAALHGTRLERLLAELVDTPVRGFVYEAAGTAGRARLDDGARIARAATARWRIPVVVVDQDPADLEAWAGAMVAAAERALGGGEAGDEVVY